MPLNWQELLEGISTRVKPRLDILATGGTYQCDRYKTLWIDVVLNDVYAAVLR